MPQDNTATAAKIDNPMMVYFRSLFFSASDIETDKPFPISIRRN
jgi:hypothetical protein